MKGAFILTERRFSFKNRPTRLYKIFCSDDLKVGAIDLNRPVRRRLNV
jgi:hypothetical protein